MHRDRISSHLRVPSTTLRDSALPVLRESRRMRTADRSSPVLMALSFPSVPVPRQTAMPTMQTVLDLVRSRPLDQADSRAVWRAPRMEPAASLGICKATLGATLPLPPQRRHPSSRRRGDRLCRRPRHRCGVRVSRRQGAAPRPPLPRSIRPVSRCTGRRRS